MKQIRKILSAIVVYLLSSFFIFSEAETVFSYEEIEVQIPVTCSEFSKELNEVYEIKIDSENEDTPAPAFDSLCISEAGTGYFKIKVIEPGEFAYRIYQTAGTDETIDYDDSIYHVTVFVETIADDKMSYAVIAEHDADIGKPEQILFKNATLEDKDIRTTDDLDENKNPPTNVPVDRETKESQEVSETIPDTDSEIPDESDPSEPSEISETSESSETFQESESIADSESTSESETVSNPDDSKTSSSPNSRVTTPKEVSSNTITEVIGSVLTGDKFQLGAVLVVMFSAVLIAVSALLCKRKHSEEEDENDS